MYSLCYRRTARIPGVGKHHTKCCDTVWVCSEMKNEQQEKIRTNIEDRNEEPVEEHNSNTNVGSGPPWDNKRGAIKGSNYTPVEGYEAHTQTVSDTENLVDLDIVRGDPADP